MLSFVLNRVYEDSWFLADDLPQNFLQFLIQTTKTTKKTKTKTDVFLNQYS